MQIQDQPQQQQQTPPDDPHPATTTAMDEAHGIYRLGVVYGRFIHRARWVVIAVWIVILAASVPFAATVTNVLSGGGYQFNGSESAHVSDALISKLHIPPSSVLIVLQSDSTPASDPAYQAEIATLTAKAQSFAHVSGVVPGNVGQDNRTTFLTVNFDKDADYMQQHFPAFRKLIPSGNVAGPARVYLTGSVATYDEFTQISNTDSQQADERALPIALVLLFFIFGTVVAGLMPVMLAAVAVPVSLAGIYLAAQFTTMASTVSVIASVIGLGLSIDYSLFMVRRYREELAKGRSVPDAVGWTVATSGEAILFSAFTVMIGFLGMLLIGIQFMTSLGIGGVLVVFSAMLAALTLLPAVLAVLGPRINGLRIPFISRFTVVTAASGERQGFWHRLALGVMRRPIMVIVGVIALVLALGWPIFSIRLGLPGTSSLPTSSEARQGFEAVQKQFPAVAENPIYILVNTPDGTNMLTAANLAKLDHLTQWVSEQAHVTSVTSLTQLPTTAGSQPLSAPQLIALYTSGAYQQNPTLAQVVGATTNNDTTLITAISDTKLDSQAGIDLVDHLRANKDQGQGFVVQVGGFQAVSSDFTRYVYGNFPHAIIFILVATFVLLLLMFRSVLIPLKAVIMNILSISAAYGVLVFVFQWGNLQSVLGFTSEGFVEDTIPIMMFCILFGLSMDYEVFLLSRVREEWLRTNNNRYAVARGLEMTGSVITNAALLLVIVAGAVTFTSLISTKEIGLGIAVAVLVDAAIIRTLLVPATMRLLGRWNWWLPGLPVPTERQEGANATQ